MGRRVVLALNLQSDISELVQWPDNEMSRGKLFLTLYT